jgi:hypothetical protein
MHQGVTKTFEYIQEIYTGMPKVVVSKFRKFCYICDLNIGHMEDHNGQYHVIWPQKKKEG